MTADQFRERMKELAATVGSDQTMDLFNQGYEELLNEVKAQPEPRYKMLVKMKQMTMVQAAFLLNGLRGKAVSGPYMATMQQ
jgi:exoribonuclease R